MAEAVDQITYLNTLFYKIFEYILTKGQLFIFLNAEHRNPHYVGLTYLDNDQIFRNIFFISSLTYFVGS